jgi:hypothetical protein
VIDASLAALLHVWMQLMSFALHAPMQLLKVTQVRSALHAWNVAQQLWAMHALHVAPKFTPQVPPPFPVDPPAAFTAPAPLGLAPAPEPASTQPPKASCDTSANEPARPKSALRTDESIMPSW